MSTQRSPRERTLETELFGRDVEFDYSETWVGYSVLGLRLVMGWIFLQAGLEKVLGGEFSSAGYLENVPAANPLSGVFYAFADLGGVIDPLVMYGQILIGLALLFGVVVRFATLMGAIQMFFFWTAGWQGGPLEGFPVEHGYFVNSELVYLLLLFGIAAVGAGRVLGVDSVLEDTDVVRNNPWLKYLLG